MRKILKNIPLLYTNMIPYEILFVLQKKKKEKNPISLPIEFMKIIHLLKNMMIIPTYYILIKKENLQKQKVTIEELELTISQIEKLLPNITKKVK